MKPQIGRYRILSELGAGGMGVVYRSLDLDLQREVAIKRLRSEFAASPNILERFQREAQLQGRLHHINIAQLYALVQTPEAFCLVMEYVDGVVLKSLIPLEWTSAVRIGIQALAGLGYAHLEGVLHRDIKPENIMIDRRGTVKIMDFGIAHAVGAQPLTREKVLIGTIEYMPPERIRGTQVDNRSDIYSMGILLFELLTGRLPHDAATEYELMNWHLKNTLPSLAHFIQCPAALDAVLARATAKNPEDRFASCVEMALALRQTLGEQPGVDSGLSQGGLDQLNSALISEIKTAAPVTRRNAEEAAGTRLVALAVDGVLFSGIADSVDRRNLFWGLTGAMALCLAGILVWWFAFHGQPSSARNDPDDHFHAAAVPPPVAKEAPEIPDQQIQDALSSSASSKSNPLVENKKKKIRPSPEPASAAEAPQQPAEHADSGRMQQEAALIERRHELDLQAADQSARQEQLEKERIRLQAEQEKAQAMVAEAERKQEAAAASRAHEQAAPPRPAPAYAGPSSGTIVWRGALNGTALVTINGNSSDVGQVVSGSLPGVLVMVQPADAKHVGVASSPAPSNSYQRLILRIQGTGDVQQTVQWSIP